MIAFSFFVFVYKCKHLANKIGGKAHSPPPIWETKIVTNLTQIYFVYILSRILSDFSPPGDHLCALYEVRPMAQKSFKIFFKIY